jgi:IS1 family transposase
MMVICRVKKNKRWVWIVLCRRTRQIVSYFIGDRSEESCQRLGRFVRRTLSFSKSDEYHEAALKVFIHEYNENPPVLT